MCVTKPTSPVRIYAYANELRQLLVRKGQGYEQKSGLGIKAVGVQRQVTDNEAHLAVAPTVAAFCWICSQPSIATHAQAVRRPARHGCDLAHWKARSFAWVSSYVQAEAGETALVYV